MKKRIFILFALAVIYAIIILVIDLIDEYNFERIIQRFPGIYLMIIYFIFITILHYISVKRLPYSDKKDAMEVHHRRSILLHEPYEKSFDLCLWSLSLVKKLKKPNYDKDKGTIEAKTGFTWKTYGDKITYKIMKNKNGFTQVEISSRPSYYYYPILDLGRNLENIETIMDYFRKSGSLEDEKIIMGKTEINVCC